MQVSALFIAVAIATTSFSINGAIPAAQGVEGAFALENAAQMISVLFAAGYSVGHVLVGLFAIRMREQTLLIFAALGFALTSLVGATAGAAELFYAMRFLQGLFASALPIVGRALAWNQNSVDDSARRLSVATAIYTWMPVAAPLTTALVISRYDWRSAFYLFAGYGLLLAILSHRLNFQRSLPTPSTLSGATIIPRIKSLLDCQSFRAGLLTTSALFSGFFALLSSSPDLASKDFQIGGIQAHHAATLIAGAFALGGAISYLLLMVWTSQVILKVANFVLVLVSLLSLLLLTQTNLYSLVLPVAAVYVLLVGIAVPNSTILAIKSTPHEKILALAIVGSLKMLLSAGFVSVMLMLPFDHAIRLILVATVAALLGYASLAIWGNEPDQLPVSSEVAD